MFLFNLCATALKILRERGLDRDGVSVIDAVVAVRNGAPVKLSLGEARDLTLAVWASEGAEDRVSFVIGFFIGKAFKAAMKKRAEALGCAAAL